MSARIGRTAGLLLLACIASGACTSFLAVQSAEVRAGPSLRVQGSISTPPGDGAAWFWSLDCAENCDHPIPGVDLALSFGSERASLGVGLNGAFPYAEAYAQLNRPEQNPYGLGARLGVPVPGWNWTEHLLYARYDHRLASGKLLLLNPTLFYHTGNSPNGTNPGSFLAFVQGIGVLSEGRNTSVVPALSVGFGRGERRRDSEVIGPFYTVFAVASVSVTFHRSRAP
ncbi:MAG TPA: hypothetical protein VFX98_07415 [Longimicrobiaceae bacterium]|nr:hypothetical protein [Longimicrobiaceae bacterium]